MCTPTRSSVQELDLAAMRKWSPSDVNKTTVGELDTLSLAGLVAVYLVGFDEKEIALFTRMRDTLISHLTSDMSCGSSVTSGNEAEMCSFLQAVDASIVHVLPGVMETKARITLEKRARAMIEVLW